MPVSALFAFAWPSSRAWTVAGWTMLHFLWIGAAVGLLAVIVRIALRRAGPRSRCAAALVLFSLLAVAPLAIGLRVSHALDDSARTESSHPAGRPQEIGATATRGTEFHSVREPAGRSGTPPWDFATADLHAPTPATPPAAVPHDASAWLDRAVNRTIHILPILWLAGSSILLAVTFVGLGGADRLRRHSTPLADGPIAEPCAALARSLRISRRVAVAICDRLAGPVLVGIVRPCILLPSPALTGWTPAQLEMVLLHELAHIRRWDNLINLLQRLVESVLFFQPAVWWVSGWLRLEREQCCDELVVSRTGRPRDYANLLLTLSDIVPRRTPLAASPHVPRAASLSMAHSHLVPRIRRILNKGVEPMSSRIAFVLLLASFAAALFLPVGLDQMATQAEDRQKADDHPPSQADGPHNVESATPDTADVPDRDATRAGERRIEPRRYHRLASSRDGVLEAVTVRRGDTVKEGQVLARLPGGPLRLAEIDLRAAEKSLEAARLKYEAAQRSNEITPNGVPEIIVKQLRVAVEGAELQVERAQAERDSLKSALVISSPIDGRVVDVARVRGEWVKAGEPVIVVAPPDEHPAAPSAQTTRKAAEPGSATSAQPAPQKPGAARAEWPLVVEAQVSPGESLTIGSRRDGVLESVSVRDGESVKKGQVLASLPTDALRIAEIDLADASKALEYAEADFSRSRALRDSNAIPENQLTRIKLEFERASLQLDRAKAEYESLRSALVIRSPIDGVVTQLRREAGESVKAGEALVDVVNTKHMLVEGWVAYAWVWLVTPGAAVEVRVRDIRRLDLPVEHKTFAGELTFVDSAIHPVTGQVRIRARIQNPDGLLKSGLQVIMEIQQPDDETPDDDNR